MLCVYNLGFHSFGFNMHEPENTLCALQQRQDVIVCHRYRLIGLYALFY